MDKLEEYIRENREELDGYNPPSGAWRGIERKLGGGTHRAFKLLSIAAMVIVVFGSALLIHKQSQLPGNLNNKTDESGLILPNPRLNETEIYYNNLVNSLYREAAPLLTGNPDVKKELNTDISQLDSIYSDIKRDLKDNMANQEVMEALIQNYRIKIRLLEDMLAILKENEGKTDKNRNHEL